MKTQQLRFFFTYYLVNILSVSVSILLITLFLGKQNILEPSWMAFLISFISLPFLNKQVEKSKMVLISTVVSSFVIPFIVFLIWFKF